MYTNKHNLTLEPIIEAMINGDSYRTIAKTLGVPLSSLHDFCSQPANIIAVRVALDISANTYQEKALEALESAPSTLTEVTRAREIASHYRWLAAKRSPATFSDKHQMDVTTTRVKTIKVTAPEPPPSENPEASESQENPE